MQNLAELHNFLDKHVPTLAGEYHDNCLNQKVKIYKCECGSWFGCDTQNGQGIAPLNGLTPCCVIKSMFKKFLNAHEKKVVIQNYKMIGIDIVAQHII